jgi:hypothetical protein
LSKNKVAALPTARKYVSTLNPVVAGFCYFLVPLPPGINAKKVLTQSGRPKQPRTEFVFCSLLSPSNKRTSNIVKTLGEKQKQKKCFKLFVETTLHLVSLSYNGLEG